jgi:hypothetical protein
MNQVDELGRWHGLWIIPYDNGFICYKFNWLNGEEISFSQIFDSRINYKLKTDEFYHRIF